MLAADPTRTKNSLISPRLAQPPWMTRTVVSYKMLVASFDDSRQSSENWIVAGPDEEIVHVGRKFKFSCQNCHRNGSCLAVARPGEAVNKSAASAASLDGFSSRDQVGC